MSEITPFQFPATGHLVRTVTIDGEPWFVAVDVCSVLGIGDARQAVNSLDEDERCTTPVADSLGREQQTYVINEAGLYSLILRSRKPDAKAFKRWITHEVLPQIRRTGSYSAAARFEIPQTLGDALRLAAAQADEIEQQRRALAVAEPKAHSWDVLASGNGDYSVGDAAKILSRDPAISIGRDRLFSELADAGWIFRAKGDGRWRAYQRHVDLDRMSELPQSYENPDTGELTLAAPQVRITVKGLRELHRQLGGIAPLRLDEQLAIEGSA